MNTSVYRLPDEPGPSGLAQYVVSPIWPLFALMFAGNLFGFGWFLFNAVALGAPGRGRDIALVATAIIGTAALILGLGAAEQNGWLVGSELKYAALSIIALKLTCGYTMFLRQSATFEVWEHYGGVPRNGMVVLVIIGVFGRNLLQNAHLPPLLLAMLR